jgi:hypothetical protein
MSVCRNAKWIQVFNSRIFGDSDGDRGASADALKDGSDGGFLETIR